MVTLSRTAARSQTTSYVFEVVTSAVFQFVSCSRMIGSPTPTPAIVGQTTSRMLANGSAAMTTPCSPVCGTWSGPNASGWPRLVTEMSVPWMNTFACPPVNTIDGAVDATHGPMRSIEGEGRSPTISKRIRRPSFFDTRPLSVRNSIAVPGVFGIMFGQLIGTSREPPPSLAFGCGAVTSSAREHAPSRSATERPVSRERRRMR